MKGKIVYNVTVKIEKQSAQDWLLWMQEVHIPDVMKTGCFLSYRMTKIVEEPDEHGIGFAIQYIAEDIQTFEKYQNNFAKQLQQEHSEKYQNKYVAFRTLLEILNEGE
ncbi:MAG: DUF4286 family protein [Saprospiraceae bacterium]